MTSRVRSNRRNLAASAAAVALFGAGGVAYAEPLTPEETSLMYCTTTAMLKARKAGSLQESMAYSAISSRIDKKIIELRTRKGDSEAQVNELLDEWLLEVDDSRPLEKACQSVDPELWRLEPKP